MVKIVRATPTQRKRMRTLQERLKLSKRHRSSHDGIIREQAHKNIKKINKQ